MFNAIATLVRKPRRPFYIVLMLATLIPALCTAANPATPIGCAKLRSLVIPGVDLNIQSATAIADGPPPSIPFAPPLDVIVPSYCRLEGEIDANDGLADGMIFAVGACRFDPSSLACKGPKTESCVTAEQASALKKGFAGPKDSRGVQVYPGFWFDTGIAAPGPIAGLLSSRGGPVGPRVSATEMDVDREEIAAATALSAIGDTANWTQLSTLKERGGKLIFYHGVSDPWFSAQDTVGYYEQLAADNGGPADVSQWSRLFLVPGMGHCSGGEAAVDRFDLLEPMVAWVERNVPPDSVIATGNAFPGRSLA